MYELWPINENEPLITPNRFPLLMIDTSLLLGPNFRISALALDPC